MEVAELLHPRGYELRPQWRSRKFTPREVQMLQAAAVYSERYARQPLELERLERDDEQHAYFERYSLRPLRLELLERYAPQHA